MARQTKKRGKPLSGRQRAAPRSWVFSLSWATAIVGVSIIGSATINPLFGRAVHWDWMAGIAPAGFVALIMVFRRRWV
jgi:hypothetical protein